ncbi:LysR substrate-binding domain-containing protein [Pendulispora brunnea]|uniref:LysR substrate-binding domain-containing protein n=1 Tax=Pendulispora brunnea TaxID=2905690 RepID=A0ABZ2KIN4_9BACT
MDLRQLEFLVTVADEANFTRAAAKLRVAQPGVSARIRQLEQELGHELLDRSGRTVRLTEMGATVLPYARAALAAVAGARLAVDEVTGLLRGGLRVGMVAPHSSTEFDLAGLLASFHRAHPAVRITLSEGTADHLVESLQTGQLDVALIGVGAKSPVGVAWHVLVDEPLVAVVSSDDPLAAGAAIPFADLRARTLLTFSRGTGLRSVLEAASARAATPLTIAFEASEPRVLVQLVARGLGVGILPESAAREHPRLRAIPIVRPRLRGRLALAWRSEAPSSPAVRAFVQLARHGVRPVTNSVTEKRSRRQGSS